MEQSIRKRRRHHGAALAIQGKGKGSGRVRRSLTCLLACLLLAGCSFTRLAYDHLGWLAHHYVAGFVELTPQQSHDFDAAFREVLQWHRETQLPEYADFMQALAASAGTVQTVADVTAQAQRAAGLGRVLAQRLLHDVAPRLALLDDAQVESLLGEIDHRITKSEKHASRLSNADWRQEQIEKTERTLEKYAGALEPSQHERIRAWSEGLERETALDHAAARAWRDQFAEILQHRHAEDFGVRLQGLLDPQAPALVAANARRDAADQRYIALLAELSSSCTPKQRQHLHDSLTALAADLEALAAERRPAT